MVSDHAKIPNVFSFIMGVSNGTLLDPASNENTYCTNAMVKPPRVLIFFPYNPFIKRSGAKARFLRELDSFSETGWTITLLTFRGMFTKWRREDTKRLPQNVKIKFFNPWHYPTYIVRLAALYLHSRLLSRPMYLFAKAPHQLCRRFEKLSDEHDVAWVHWAFWGPLGLKAKCYTILDAHDHITQNITQKYGPRLIPPILHEEMLKLESQILKSYNLTIAISKQEQTIFRDLGAPRVACWPHVLPPRFIPLNRERVYDIFTIASDSWNNVDALIWFIHTVYPRIVTKRPETRFAIAGSVCKRLETHTRRVPSTFLLGSVEDLQPVFERSSVFLSVFAAGTGAKIKLMEGLSRGMSVTGNPDGLRGLESLPPGCIMNSDASEFAEATLRLLMVDAERVKSEKANRSWYSKFYSTSLMEESALLDQIRIESLSKKNAQIDL